MKDRFFIEKKNDPRDFPFYNGQPRSIAMSQWLIMLGIVFIGFLIASFWIPNVPGAFTILIVVLFSCMNLIFGLGSLSIFAGKDAFTLFKKFNVKDLPFLLGTLILNIVYSLVASGIVGIFSKTNANPAAITHAEGSRALTHLLLNTLSDIPTLLGEEFLATLPFLALLYFFLSTNELVKKQKYRSCFNAFFIDLRVIAFANLSVELAAGFFCDRTRTNF
ncbi:hypothetical protein [Enterococcus pallens]|uniref:Uncharacterized protein n=1 Tax=Enterococcus pallens ATCC BAA-351 TaxID=1158607 RepID=R2T5S2_9ENTE|nr:hypothetical protein [Enterococcus pallens]EOH95594.1 hypothetical protein UAU_01556 [Enterococcus pallens ATCC BAA-351]EOU21269.1 hypothetical protein I588_02116 [Enterococcus pallens ATCC BAA-351]